MNIQQPKRFKILLLGDTCDDVYQYGLIERLSPEAPVPIFCKKKEVVLEGMASNVRNNLLNLGCDVVFAFGNSPSRKIRLIDSRSGQHIVRVDEDHFSDPIDVNKLLDSTIDQYDCIVISDYDKGSIGYHTIFDVTRQFKGPIFIDTKKTTLGAFDAKNLYVKINELEKNRLKSESENVIITLGSRGAEYKNKLFSAEKIDVVDVTGAGDTFLAALAVEYLQTKSIEDAIHFAIRASAITVSKFGVYAPKREEICGLKD